jgi:hypothetical protein
MFRKILTVLVCLLIFASAHSQVWISKGAVWHYNWESTGGGSGGFVRINYEKDTLTNKILCEKLTSIYYEFCLGPNQTTVQCGKFVMPTQYTYVSGDTVFYLVNGQFQVLYNFGAKPGDTWNLGVDTNSNACSKSIVHVDSIGKMVINGSTFRWISLSTNQNASAGMGGKSVERFGAIGNNFFELGT